MIVGILVVVSMKEILVGYILKWVDWKVGRSLGFWCYYGINKVLDYIILSLLYKREINFLVV